MSWFCLTDTGCVHCNYPIGSLQFHMFICPVHICITVPSPNEGGPLVPQKHILFFMILYKVKSGRYPFSFLVFFSMLVQSLLNRCAALFSVQSQAGEETRPELLNCSKKIKITNQVSYLARQHCGM